MIDSEKQIGFRGTVVYRQKLKQAALDRGVNVQNLIEQALEAYLSANPSPSEGATSTVYIKTGKSPIPFAPGVTSKYPTWHRKLEDILGSGIKDAIDAVTRNINVFHEYVSIRKGELAATGEGKAQEPGRSEATHSKHGQDLPKGTRRGA